MTIASVLITAAFREGNLIPVGQAPTAAEQTEALPRLNNYVKGVFGYEMGEELTDWPVPSPQRTAPVAANYPQAPLAIAVDLPSGVYPYPPRNSRIVFGGATTTVYFPEAPLDGSRMSIMQGYPGSYLAGTTVTLDGNGRTIEGTPTKAYVAPVTARQWFYRADLGDWKAVVPLLVGDDMPFPDEFDDLWICALAIRLAPRFGKVPSDETKGFFMAALSRLKARYRQAGVTTYGSDNITNGLQSFPQLTGGWAWFV